MNLDDCAGWRASKHFSTGAFLLQCSKTLALQQSIATRYHNCNCNLKKHSEMISFDKFLNEGPQRC